MTQEKGETGGHGDPPLQDQLKGLSRRPGVYLFRDKGGTVIYVGKAQDLRQRVRSYFQQGTPASPRLQSLRSKIHSLSTIVTDSEEEAFILESNLIKEHAPRFNVQFKDDKHYPYLCFTMGEDFPRLEVARRLTAKDCRYFGPYSNAGALRETLRLIKKIFPLRSCRQPLREGKLRGRPCLNFQIKRCLAPCRGELSSRDYAAVVQQVCLFLEGRQRTLLRKIEGAMKEAADSLHFEKAARLRDQHASVIKIMERQKVLSADGRDRDVIALETSDQAWVVGLFRVRGGKLLAAEYFIPSITAEADGAEIMKEFLRHYYGRASFIPGELLLSPLPAEQELLEQWFRKQNNNKRVKLYQPRRGEKKALLELVQKNALLHLRQLEERREREQDALSALAGVLHLPLTPRRIEGYDISHFAGRETVGSMVVFHEGKPWKEGYRRFIIRESPPADDYAALAEVLQRRLLNEEIPLPDLLLVDGGRGQLSAAAAVFAATARPAPALVALAKEHEQIFLPGSTLPLTLPPNHPGLKLLQQVRDEAHRLAITHSRGKQARRSLSSMLTAVPGIGPARSKALLQHFGGLEGLRTATPAELAAVPGMTKTVAAALYAYLQDNVL
ncbi:MAG: excinuclease ABC subunit UvrC [Bacillota bacterium]